LHSSERVSRVRFVCLPFHLMNCRITNKNLNIFV
jgi:hypothetical protein